MTILYISDFNKYPNAIIDLDTPNKSWVEFAAKLKAMGVKNWGFHLTLLDPTLKGVNPRDPNLDKMTILKIQMEARNNWWYYLREIFLVPNPAGGESSYYSANRGNIAAIWSIFNHFITFNEQIRQTGKSLLSRAIATGFHSCWAEGSTHILFTKSDLRPDEIKWYKDISESIPKYLRYKHPKDKDNQQEFTTECHGNRTFSYIPQGDPKSATKIGRGKTPTYVNGDEVPFLDYAHISIPALISSTNRSFDEAKTAGSFYGILYTTTAGDLSTEEGKYVYEKIRSRCMFFSEMLYDCTDRYDAIQMIKANSNSGTVPYVLIAFNHLQLGYTDEWLQEKIDSNTGSKDQMKRDLLGIWTFGSQANPIKEEVLTLIRANKNETPKNERFNKYYNVRFHKPMDYVKERHVVMGLDMSEAIGRDSITIVGIDVETGETLLAADVNEANLTHFGIFMAQFLKDFPLITLVPEAKSAWMGLRDQLLIELPKLGIDPGRRIYNTIVDNARGTDVQKKEYKLYTEGYPSERKYYPFRNTFGFKTNSESREVLTRDVMISSVKDYATVVRDAKLIDELSTLVERKGRIDHALSGHDDHVISYSLAHWFLRFGRNLEHYGINTRLILSKKQEVKIETPQDIRENKRQQRLEIEVERIYERLEKTKSSIEQEYLLRKLDLLNSELDVLNKDVDLYSRSLDQRSSATRDLRRRPTGKNTNKLFSRRNW